MSGRRYLAALMFIAFELAGCSLVEQVVVIEPRIERAKEAVKPSRTASRGVATAAGELKCAEGMGGPGCGKEVISKSYSARYDSGPVLKPIRKTPENKPGEASEDSAFVSVVKSWIKTGMQLPGWAGPK